VTHFYHAYGVTLASDTPIPGLKQIDSHVGRPDLALSFGLEPDWVREAKRLPCRLDHPKPSALDRNESAGAMVTSFGAGQFFQLAYRDGTQFVVDAAAERLWGTCLPSLTIDDIATYLSGPVMGFILRRRGLMSLHASAVCIDGRAVALCGESQSGKSTSAAAFALRGVPVLCEDVTPLLEEAGEFQVVPGYPRVCLWPDAVESLLGKPNALPQLTPTWEKCFLPLDRDSARFESQKRPLGVIYLLAQRSQEDRAPCIEEVSPREALLELVQNTYVRRLLDRMQRAAEFDVLSRVVMQAPIRRIVPHVDFARVGVLCDLVVADAERLFGNLGSNVAHPNN
jgi:hypothetical protein